MPLADDTAIARALTEFLRRAGLEIEVTCDGGVAVLSGAVPSETARTAAVDLARAHDGVADVVSRLTVAARERRHASPGR
jgi:osmotically-inducible protein OsmY